MKRVAGNRGFGVVEILIAVAIFSVVSAGLLTTTVGATRGNLHSRNLGTASALVYAKVEQLRALDPATNPVDIVAGDHDDPLNPMTATGQANGKFTRSWTVTEDVPRHGVSEVVITVSWPGVGASSVRGVTYVCYTPTCG